MMNKQRCKRVSEGDKMVGVSERETQRRERGARCQWYVVHTHTRTHTRNPPCGCFPPFRRRALRRPLTSDRRQTPPGAEKGL